MSDQVKDIIAHSDALLAERQAYETRWQEIADLAFPNSADVTTQTQPGANRRARMFSNAGEIAGEKFANSMHSLMTGEGQPWFHLATRDRSKMNLRTVRVWLQEAERRLYDVLNSPNSSFHLAQHETNLQLGFFGSGPKLIIDRPGRAPLFMALPLPECCFERNQDNRVDTIIRRYTHTAKELVQAFPKAGSSDKVTKALAVNSQTRFTCIHAIRPRKNAITGSRMALAMPWESVYVLLDDKMILQEDGFESFPAVVSRWIVKAGETYGRGCGDRALPDLRMLMLIKQTQIKARQLAADPPMNVPDGAYQKQLGLTPGKLNYLTPGHGEAKPIHTIDMHGLLAADTMAAETENAVREAFYNDLFQLDGPVTDKGAVQHMSATEAAIRQRDKLGQLGPIFSRLKVEDLGPTIGRTLFLMERNRMLPPAPPEIADEEVLAEYVSPLAIAQETGDVATIMEGLNLAAAVESVSPGATDILAGDRVLAVGLRALRFREEGMRSEEEVEEVRRARAESEMAVQQSQLAVDQSSALKNVADAQATLQ